MRTHIGPHRVQLWLGSGGDAEVWAAEEAVTGARIAVKLTLTNPSAGRAGRIVREYQYLRMLDVPGVPRARGLGVEDDGRLFLSMDLVEGVAAGHWAEKLLFDVKEQRDAVIPRIQRALARAGELLARVHGEGLLHGDVKPSCFLVGARDAVSMVDFGGSRPIVEQQLTRRIDESFGTAPYSSIEALHKAPPTHAAEVWSMSAAAFRMLTGELPVGRGTRAELRERWPTVSDDELRARLIAGAPGLSTRAADAVIAGFARTPEARPALVDWCAALRDGALADRDAAGDAPAAAVAEHPYESPLEPTAGVRHELRAEMYDRGTRLVRVLEIAGEPLPPRVLALAAGRSTRGALQALRAAKDRVKRAGTLGWTTRTPLAATLSGDAGIAAALADALADEPVGAARIRALAVAGRHEEMVGAFERWVAALATTNRWSEASALARLLPPVPAPLAPRFALAKARAAMAGAELDVALDDELAALCEREPLLAPALARARWAMARHFGSFHVDATPASLAVGWRAQALGELDAALAAAETALDEARWLRRPDAEADALLLLAQLLGARGETSRATRCAAEAIDRWPAASPGIGEALATLARLRHLTGAWSEGRRLVATRAAEAPTLIDRAHLLLALAELELGLDHVAVVDDALTLIETLLAGGRAPIAIEARRLALRTKVPGRLSAIARAEDAELRVRELVAEGLALHVPHLAAAHVEAAIALGHVELARDTLGMAHSAATFMQDVAGRMAASIAGARYGAAVGEPIPVAGAVLTAARAAGWWSPLMHAFEAMGDHDAAWSAASRVLAMLDLADGNALSLTPWVVAAQARAGRP